MILLDTQTLIWWTEGDVQLSERHRRLIADGEADGINACAISAWEVGMLVGKNRLSLSEPPQEWLNRLLEVPTFRFLPVTAQVMLDAATLPEPFHKDPADRTIVATARAYDLTLLTTDAKILAYSHVRSIGPR